MPSSLSRIGLGLLTIAMAFVMTLDAASAKRVALVMGNSRYQNAPVLGNPANDAQDLAQSLRSLGFEVIEQHDANRDAMVKAVRDFTDELPGADLALFFYAGHGLQMNGENYLLPINVQIQKPADVRFNTINLSDIQGEMEGGGRTAVMILDACRDNPFTDKLAQGGRSLGGRGLQRLDATAQGSLIVYSTQPNAIALDGTGRNSPFMTALLKHVTTPGLEVRQMISRVRADVLTATDQKQTPWDNSSLVGDVYLSGAPQTAPAQVATAMPAEQPPAPPAQAPVPATQTPAPTRQSTAPEPATSGEESPPQTECEKLAAFHMPATSTAEVREAAATDWTRAAALCQAEMQAHPGDPRFIYALGRAQAHLKNYLEALRDFRAAADAGHVDALVELGILYVRGEGVVRSYPMAFACMSKAAEAGSSRALGNLAALYGNGWGVPRDDAKALDLAEKAIEAGNPNGLEVVANAYFSGHGVPRDYQMAAQYMQQSVALGDGLSMKRLANMFESGYLGPPDPAKASELRLMAEKIDPESQDPVPAHLPMLRQRPAPTPLAHRRRYVVFRPVWNRRYMGQPMVGGIFKAPAPGATCCPPGSLICPGALPRC